MLFNSITFFVFFALVLIVYYALSTRSQNYWLLAASYVFYGYWDWRFLSLLWISTIVDFLVGRALGDTTDPGARKRLVTVSVCVNLGILGLFKYYGFFVHSFEALLTGLGFRVHGPTLEILLPVGISFYTFQTLSYSLDIYRGKIRPTRDPVTFALFVAYFPQLVAGPIERARNLLPRLTAPRIVGWPAIGIGLELMMIGYLKKVGIADTLGALVDQQFRNPGLGSGSELLLSAYLFSFQIYCDFSGYSDIARGTSRLLGIDLMRNFEQPYLSRSITEFWRRWHISLSSWLRDYLYISLGGNRRGRSKTYRNLMLTMLLGGLWHGASWTFVVWGGIHGLYLAAHKWLLERRRASVAPGPGRSFLTDVLKILATFHLVTLTWIFFRADTFGDAFVYLRGIVTWQSGVPGAQELSWSSPRLLLLIGTLLAIDIIQARRGDHAVFLRWRWLPRGLAYGFLVTLTLTLGNLNENVPFIYFQF